MVTNTDFKVDSYDLSIRHLAHNPIQDHNTFLKVSFIVYFFNCTLMAFTEFPLSVDKDVHIVIASGTEQYMCIILVKM